MCVVRRLGFTVLTHHVSHHFNEPTKTEENHGTKEGARHRNEWINWRPRTRAFGGEVYLSALNRRPVPGVECHQADIADLDAIRPAFEGIDVVVHLAAMAQPGRYMGRIVKWEYRGMLQRLRGIAGSGR